jgi:hypothetical protein
MPMPSTSKWPKPRSDDEFEDMVVDFLRILWRDPHATRNGRRGQRQDGVDVIGRPEWLNGKMAGAQCKNVASVSLGAAVDEVEKAKRFTGGLGEFLFVTTADRDAALQAVVRQHFASSPPPFDVQIIFWPDVVSDLSSDDTMVAKHWKGFPGTTRPVDTLPAPVWMDRRGVRDEESVECQCELTLFIPEDTYDFHVGELANEFHRISQEGIAPRFFQSGLQETKSPIDTFAWTYRVREFANVLFGLELEIADRGRMTYRWAEFTDGTPCLFKTSQLVGRTTLAIGVFQCGAKRLAERMGTRAPARIGTRFAAHASGPMVLHDNCDAVEQMFYMIQAPPDWALVFESDWSSAVPIHLVNRVLANFNRSEGGRVAFPRIKDSSLSALVKRIYSEARLSPLE